VFSTCRLKPLRQVLADQYTAEELETLCFDLGVKYDSLPGQGTPAKARELLVYLNHRGRIPDLIMTVREQRPNNNWDEIVRLIESPLACLGPPRRQALVVLAAVIALVAVLALLALATGSIRPGSTPTPTPPATFLYQVRALAEGTGAPVRDAKVIVELSGAPPLDGLTDRDGVAPFPVDMARDGQPARIIVEATGYQRFDQAVNLTPSTIKDVLLSPAPAP